jgi:hypothetical protein
MEHYVTLFDSLFLPQGLALHMSMERHASSYTLWILCMDDEAFEVLQRINLPHVRLLQLGTLETEELKRVKPTRTIAEYCWTCTSFTPRFVFEADPSANRVTYLDADLWFRKNPAPIFREFDASGKHVLITDHAYAPEYDQSAASGQYCVQFMTFTREGGEVVRKWWEDRCIEWCYARYEEGRFGDQKYLDDWPQRFAEYVHVLKDKELALAPWNATRFPYGNAIVWHFHSLRISMDHGKPPIVLFGIYPLPKTVRKNIYSPYLSDLSEAISIIGLYGFAIKSQITHKFRSRLMAWLSGLYQELWRFDRGIRSRL